MKRILAGLSAFAALALAGAAAAAPLSYCNTPLDTVQAAINTCVIGPVNTSLVPQGAGSLANTVTVDSITSPVNLLEIGAGATGNRPYIIAGGANSDTNVGIILAGQGTGSVLLGGTTTTLAGLQIAQPASRVNDIIITPGATGTVPTLISGGAGADANIGMLVGTVGTGSLSLGGPTTALAPLKATPVASGVNQVVVTGSVTGTAPSIAAVGDANRNLNVTAAGTGIVTLGGTAGTGGLSCTSSGSTPQTCNGQRGIATTNSLTTAAATNAAYVINNSSVTTSSLVACTTQAYSGTLVTNGYPVIMSCVPGSGTITVNITNTHAANALSGTVQIGFVVLN